MSSIYCYTWEEIEYSEKEIAEIEDNIRRCYIDEWKESIE